jgi:hypothetical protein
VLGRRRQESEREGETRERGRRGARDAALDGAVLRACGVAAHRGDDRIGVDSAEAIAAQKRAVGRLDQLGQPRRVAARDDRLAAPVAQRRAVQDHRGSGLAAEDDGHHAQTGSRQGGQRGLRRIGLLAVGEEQQDARARALRAIGAHGRSDPCGDPGARLGEQRVVERGSELRECRVIGRERREQHALAGEGRERGAIAGPEPREHRAREGARSLEPARRHVPRQHARRDVEQDDDVHSGRRHAHRTLAEARAEQAERGGGERAHEQPVASAWVARRRRAEQPSAPARRRGAAEGERDERRGEERRQRRRERAVRERRASHGTLRARPRATPSSRARARQAAARNGSGRGSPAGRGGASRSVRSSASISAYTAARSAELRAAK